MSGRESDSSYERIDSAILEPLTDLEANRKGGDEAQSGPEHGVGSPSGSVRRGAPGNESPPGAPKPKTTIPPPIPAVANRKHEEWAPGALPLEGADRLEGSGEPVLGALSPFYERSVESEHLAPDELENISLRIDPDKLPSLAPLPLPEPEKRSPMLMRWAMVAAVTVVGGVAWTLGYDTPPPDEPRNDDLLVGEAVAAPSEPAIVEARSEEKGELPPAVLPEPEVEKAKGPEASPEEESAPVEKKGRADKEAEADEAADRAASSATGTAKGGQKANSDGVTAEPEAVGKAAGAESGESQPAAAAPAPTGEQAKSGYDSPGAGSADPSAQGTTSPETEPGTEPAAANEESSEKTAADPAQSPGPAKEELDRDDVTGGIDRIKDRVQTCAGDRHGIAKVEITIGSSGRVSRAVVTGVFAGTAEGSCIARSVRAARFPAFSGSPITVEYPFVL